MQTVASIEIAHPKEKLDYEVKNSTKKKNLCLIKLETTP